MADCASLCVPVHLYFVSIMGLSMNLRIYLLLSCLLAICCSNDEQSEEDFYTIDSFTISEKLGPYDWHYIRVELPPLNSSVFLEVDQNVAFDLKKIKNRHKSQLPVICFRNGGPPLPDFSDVALESSDEFHNASTKYIENLWNAGQCYYIWRRISIEFTTEKILPGVLFIGLFNGIGAIRTQAKMINRGSTYDLSTAIIVKECKNKSMRGQFCNQTVEQLSCGQSLLHKLGQSLKSIKMHNQAGTRLLTCNKFSKRSCDQDLNPKTYSFDVVQPAEELVISTSDFRSSEAQFTDSSGNNLMCYAQYGAIPGNVSYDYAVDLTRMPLVIPLPKTGTWYFMIEPIDNSNRRESRLKDTINLCHSVQWRVFECPDGKAGPNCTWERYMLKVVERDNSDAFFVYTPAHVNMPVELHNLPLEPLLSNNSSRIESEFAWTYFVFDVQQGASGKNIRIDMAADTNMNYELYVRFGGLPSLRDWDYFYINQTSNSDNGTSMFRLYDSSARRVNAYLLYPREGRWSFGLRPQVLSNPPYRTILSLSVESCPNQCSDHGACTFHEDKEGSSFYKYYFCKCDRRYGGFDCSSQLVSESAQRWHVIFLTASNAAALLPAVWALHQKAFSDWVVFISSGVASAIYHACDVGSWCALPFHVLQFMDFWLSFMAVVSTFIYLAFINEASRRTMNTISTIVTALIAINGPTKSRNIPLVLALGALGLMFAWLMELFSTCKSNSLSLRSCWNIQLRWQEVSSWFPDLLKTLNKRFKWRFMFVGFIALSMAALSWNLESVESYWIWHSAWHLSIYTSAFFFLCSRSTNLNSGRNEAIEEDESRSQAV